jgi:hypothetical protein
MCKALPALQTGSQIQMQQQGDILTFVREDKGTTLLCIFNLSDKSQRITMPPGHWLTLALDLGSNYAKVDTGDTLGPWQYSIAKKI